MKRILILTVTLITFSGCGMAAKKSCGCDEGRMGKGQPQSPLFSDIDTNSDGKVSENELATFRANRMKKRAEEGRRLKNANKMVAFSDMDLNNDNFVSKNEFAEHKKRRHGKKKRSCKK